MITLGKRIVVNGLVVRDTSTLKGLLLKANKEQLEWIRKEVEAEIKKRENRC